ncbi:MAG: acyltransferase family protein, partial [Acidimicrobiales bacterium]
MTTSVAPKPALQPAGTPNPSRTSTPSLSNLAAAAGANRNRAVDFYRAVAMGAVALGHWAAIAITVDAGGNLVSGNALEQAPSLAAMSWLFQVMPLFFVVGGFSSAMSLDAHNRRAGKPQDWVAARLRRMLAPTAVLATTWLALLAAGSVLGVGSLVATGAVAAAIPLWFLANYTVDTAIAPYLLPRFRRNPGLVAGLGVGLFLALEAIRFAGVPYLPQINWILGWLLFQMAGFAWRDGLLPTGRALFGAAAGLWVLAVAAVTVGPYPVSMVPFPGIGDLSPTHPPSLALMLFGSAYSATALVAAPAISRWLARPSSAKAWSAVVAANSVAMSVYLWHFTAAVAAGAVLYGLGLLPTAAVGTAAWWVQKLPLIALSSLVLIAIVAVVARFEQRALLAPRVPWRGGAASMMGLAAAVSIAIKLWTNGSVPAVVAGAVAVVAARHLALGTSARAEHAVDVQAEDRADVETAV